MDLSVNVKTYEPSISGAVAENELNNHIPSDCAKKYQHSREKKSTGKKNGFTSRTIAPTLPKITYGPPNIKGEWVHSVIDESQIPELLDWIKDLRSAKLTGTVVVMDWMQRRIQPLQKRVKFSFDYLGIKDPSSFSSK